jgi:hypothetical protein
MVTVLAGLGGLGKSQWTALLAAENPGVTLIATAEDSPSTTVRPRLEAVGADLERVHFVSIQTDDGLEDGVTIPDDIDTLDALLAKLGANLLVVDPLVAHLPGEIDSHKDQSVRRALAPLYRLAEARGCAVVALMHLNKAQGWAPLARLGGSSAFGNFARSVLLLDRDPDDPDGEEGNRRVLAHVKCNVAPLAPSLLYEVEPILLPATLKELEVETSRLELIGESPHNGRALLASANEEERSALDEAKEFLLAELGDGARHPAESIFKAARPIGIRDRTLQRARTDIGAKTGKADFGRGWEWWLPTPAAKAPSETGEPAFLHEGDSHQVLAPSDEEGVDEDTITQLGLLSLGELDQHRDGVVENGKRPFIGDKMYPVYLADTAQAGHLTQTEFDQQLALHRRVEMGGRERMRRLRERLAARSAEFAADDELGAL